MDRGNNLFQNIFLLLYRNSICGCSLVTENDQFESMQRNSHCEYTPPMGCVPMACFNAYGCLVVPQLVRMSTGMHLFYL